MRSATSLPVQGQQTVHSATSLPVQPHIGHVAGRLDYHHASCRCCDSIAYLQNILLRALSFPVSSLVSSVSQCLAYEKHEQGIVVRFPTGQDVLYRPALQWIPGVIFTELERPEREAVV